MKFQKLFQSGASKLKKLRRHRQTDCIPNSQVVPLAHIILRHLRDSTNGMTKRQVLPNELFIHIASFLKHSDLVSVMAVNMLFLTLGLQRQYTVTDLSQTELEKTSKVLLRLRYVCFHLMIFPRTDAFCSIPLIAGYIQTLKIRHPYEPTSTGFINALFLSTVPLMKSLRTVTFDCVNYFPQSTVAAAWRAWSPSLQKLSVTSTTCDLTLLSLESMSGSRLTEFEFIDSSDPQDPLDGPTQKILADFILGLEATLDTLKVAFALNTDITTFFTSLGALEKLSAFELRGLCTLSEPSALGEFLLRASPTVRRVRITWDPEWL